MTKQFITLDSLFKRYNQNITPGIAVMVIQQQKIMLKKGYGYKNLIDKTPILSSSNFNLASLSKAFTAAAILLLETRGLIKASDPINKYFSNVSNHYSSIKISDLIYHTSGLPNYAKRCWERNELVTNEKIILYLKNDELCYKPGERFEYNDTGYILLASLIEKITSFSFLEFLSQTIFNPCQMVNTTIAHLAKTPIVEQVIGYSEWPFFETHNEHPGDLVYGDGAVYSSLDDLFHWVMALEQTTLFSEDTKKKIFTSGLNNNQRSLNYGYGWIIDKFNKLACYHHSGEWIGFRNHIINVPQKSLWIIVLSNSSGTNAVEIAHRILSALI